MSNRTRLALFVTLILSLGLAACGGQSTSPASNSNGSPQATLPAVTNGEGGGQPESGSSPPSATDPGNLSPAPETNQNGQAGEGTAKPGGEGGGQPESGSSLPSVTDPGNLPPAPETNQNSQAGEEQMAVYKDTQGRYQILFVNGWTSSAGDIPSGVKSSSQDSSAQVEVVNGSGQSALAFATADEAKVTAAVAGYQRLALKEGQIPYGPVASLIYRYQAGQNAVTGKALEFIAARIYIPRQGAMDMAIITVTGPAPSYVDMTQLFDRIVISFKWL